MRNLAEAFSSFLLAEALACFYRNQHAAPSRIYASTPHAICTEGMIVNPLLPKISGKRRHSKIPLRTQWYFM